MLLNQDEEFKILLAPFFQKTSNEVASHLMHVRTGWMLLTTYGNPKAFEYAAIGYRIFQKPDAEIGYHSTITTGYMYLIYHAMRQSPNSTFEELQYQYPILFKKSFQILREFYSDERLRSYQARMQFLDGDIKPLPFYID